MFPVSISFLLVLFCVCVSSYGLGTYIGHPTAQRSHVDCNQLHSRKMPASSDSTHDCLFAARIVGRVTYSLPLGRSISPPLLYKIKKKKPVLQNHNLWPDWFLAIKLDGEGERGREREREREKERDRQCQKVSLPPLQHEASVADKTI